MAEVHATNDEFFTKLAALFSSRIGKDHGSVHLSQKPFTYGTPVAKSSQTDPLADLTPLAEPVPLLVRVSDGKSKEAKKVAPKVKLSTIVQPGDIESFYTRYAEVCRAGMTGLKKRDRSGRKKAKKKKGTTAADKTT